MERVNLVFSRNSRRLNMGEDLIGVLLRLIHHFVSSALFRGFGYEVKKLDARADLYKLAWLDEVNAKFKDRNVLSTDKYDLE